MNEYTHPVQTAEGVVLVDLRGSAAEPEDLVADGSTYGLKVLADAGGVAAFGYTYTARGANGNDVVKRIATLLGLRPVRSSFHPRVQYVWKRVTVHEEA